jgi:hypothetical protein
MYTVIEKVLKEHDRLNENDNSYYNSKLDVDSEYCQNTSAWD